MIALRTKATPKDLRFGPKEPAIRTSFILYTDAAATCDYCDRRLQLASFITVLALSMRMRSYVRFSQANAQLMVFLAALQTVSE